MLTTGITRSGFCRESSAIDPVPLAYISCWGKLCLPRIALLAKECVPCCATDTHRATKDSRNLFGLQLRSCRRACGASAVALKLKRKGGLFFESLRSFKMILCSPEHAFKQGRAAGPKEFLKGI